MAKKKQNKKKPKKINLRALFSDLQTELEQRLGTARRNLNHPGAKGEITEAEWRSLLSTYLPTRYSITKGFVVDSRGRISDEIDLIIHDRHFSPLFFHHASTCFVPAEAVYGVLEVKPELSLATVRYAGSKAASVRALTRTSANIVHIGGKHRPTSAPPPIFAGLLASKSGWGAASGTLSSALASLAPERRLDLGCAAKDFGFRAKYQARTKPRKSAGGSGLTLDCSDADTSLVFFVLELLGALQAMGSAPAIDYEAYAKSL